MEKPVLVDADKFPTDEIIFSHIGNTKIYWQQFFEELHAKYPEFSEQWRYYNDGKSWLLKIANKSKTILWVSVFKDSFKTAFYFGEKAEQKILSTDISEQLKIQFKNGKKFGKIKEVIVTPSSDDDIVNVISLIESKLKSF